MMSAEQIIVKVAKEEHKWRQKFGATTTKQNDHVIFEQDENISPADFWIGTKEWPQFIMIERKTFDDFHSSLIDRRLEQQRNRMLEEKWAKKTHFIGFLLEGEPKNRRVTYRKLDGAIENLICKYGCFVLFSQDLNHTRDIVHDLARKTNDYMQIAQSDGFAPPPSTLIAGAKKNKSHQRCI